MLVPELCNRDFLRLRVCSERSLLFSSKSKRLGPSLSAVPTAFSGMDGSGFSVQGFPVVWIWIMAYMLVGLVWPLIDCVYCERDSPSYAACCRGYNDPSVFSEAAPNSIHRTISSGFTAVLQSKIGS